MSNRTINPERLLLESEKYLGEAHDAYASKDLTKAGEYLFLAADRMERLLPVSPPQLVEARLKAIEGIGDFIEQIQGEIRNGSAVVQNAHETVVDSKKGALRPGSERPLFSVEEKPAIKLSDVAGMETLKELIRTKLIYPSRDPVMAAKYGIKRGMGILLYGLPGTGKSMFARAIAGEFEAAFIYVKVSDILDSLYGQTEKNLAALFAQAKKYPTAVICFDELDAIGADRDSTDSHMRRFTNQLLVELQGFSSSLENIIVLGATNKPWLLDKALIRSGRLDEMFYVPLPDAVTRREIWRLNLENKITDKAIDLDALAAISEGLSGADIAGICTKSNTEAYRKAVQTRAEVPVTQTDLIRFFPAKPADLHQAELGQLQEFARLYDRNTDVAPEIPAPSESVSLVWDQPADVEAFWRLLCKTFPTDNKTASEVAELCQEMDFSEMANLLSAVLKNRMNPNTRKIEFIAVENFIDALKDLGRLQTPALAEPIQSSSIISESQAREKNELEAAPVETQTALESPLLPSALPLEADQITAMGIITEHRALLGDTWNGFVDEVRNSREINLTEFRQRIQSAAEEQIQQREMAALEKLFLERKTFLEPALIAKIESALKDGRAVTGELAKEIHDQSYEHFVGHVLDKALNELALEPSRSRRLKRKAFRRITRTHFQPTRDSAQNLLRWLDKRMRSNEEEHRRKSQHVSSAAAAIVDVNELIIPPGLVDFSDVAGMAKIKNQLEDAMDLCLDPKKRALYLRKTGHDPLTVAMLLYGAPGTGKTFIARAAAGEFAQKFNFTVMHVPHDSIRSLHYTKKLTRIREIFELAKKRSPALVVWDEFDELATPPRFSGRKYDSDVCATLKQEFEGAVQSDKIVLHLATSNHPWQIDPALLRDGRIGSHIHVLPPDLEARREFWELFTENAEIADDLDFDQLAVLSDGMTIAEIREILKTVSAEVIRVVMRGDADRRFQNDDFLRQLTKQPARHFKTWLAEGEAAFRGRYASQRDLFPGLLKDFGVYLTLPVSS